MATVEGITREATDAAVTSSSKVGGGEVGAGAVRVGAGGMVGGVGSSKTPTKPRTANVTPVPSRTPPSRPNAKAHVSNRRPAGGWESIPSKSDDSGGRGDVIVFESMGADQQSIRVTVGESPIDSAALVAEVGRSDSGATVLFLGTVRDHSEGKADVTHLEYEVFAERVEPKIREIVEEAAGKWPVLSAAVEHRSGRVDLGEASVAVAVSCAHRADSFEAARYVIDELKQRAPIWKKELWPGGAEWSPGS